MKQYDEQWEIEREREKEKTDEWESVPRALSSDATSDGITKQHIIRISKENGKSEKEMERRKKNEETPKHQQQQAFDRNIGAMNEVQRVKGKTAEPSLSEWENKNSEKKECHFDHWKCWKRWKKKQKSNNTKKYLARVVFCRAKCMLLNVQNTVFNSTLSSFLFTFSFEVFSLLSV